MNLSAVAVRALRRRGRLSAVRVGLAKLPKRIRVAYVREFNRLAKKEAKR